MRIVYMHPKACSPRQHRQGTVDMEVDVMLCMRQVSRQLARDKITK
jgi:hypothetical protein